MTLPALPPLPYLHGVPTTRGVIRSCPEDFVVEEELGFAPDGQGQHRLLHIEKRNTNTEWLARQLARFAGVDARDVGYAGLKDRNAVTRQWFSVDLAGRPEPAWHELGIDDVRLLQVAPHGRKLRRGSLDSNRFTLRVRDLHGDREELEARVRQIGERGVPNYFMEQRFGHDEENLRHAAEMFAGRRVKDRHRRGLYLSAARSMLFNCVLAARIEQGRWETVLAGDVLMLNGSHSVFVVDSSAELERSEARLAAHDVHLTGPLWGKGSMARDEAEDFERAALSELHLWREGLERADMQHQRRSLRVVPAGLSSSLDGDDLLLQFTLPAGSYATAVLREIVTRATDQRSLDELT